MVGAVAAMGGSGILTINLPDVTVNYSAPTTGSYGFGQLSNGNAWAAGGDDSDGALWLTNGSGSNYEVYATLSSGAITSGTTGSWLNLGTARIWEAAFDAVLAIQIRDAFTLAVVDTATITMNRV